MATNIKILQNDACISLSQRTDVMPVVQGDSLFNVHEVPFPVPSGR